jgi:hypothetical protein
VATIRNWSALAAAPVAEWDTRRMNALVNQMQQLQMVIRESDEGRKLIEQLAVDPEPRVRGWAAVHASKWNLGLARRVLTEVRDGGGVGSFEAKWTILELDAGRLNVDWRPNAASDLPDQNRSDPDGSRL